jgi:hydrogenase maturation protease
MSDLREQLDAALRGKVCVVGVGNPDYGDDGLGVRLAEALAAGGIADVCVAAASPERYLGQLSEGAFDTCLFLDAVECGAAPGSILLLNSGEMASRFPQVSTHKIALGMLAQLIESNGRTRVYLLGVQPESLRASGELTPTVRVTLDLLRELLGEKLRDPQAQPAKEEAPV